jgi:hypothetical protein
MIERKVLRGFLANVEVLPPLIVTFQYNPATISDNKAVSYVDAEEKSDPPRAKLYKPGGHRTISFGFQLHGLEQGMNVINPTALDNGISTELAKLRSFLYPAADAWDMIPGPFGSQKLGVLLKSPPTCYFGFGTRILECQITDMTIKELQHNSLLAPVRADVAVTLNVLERGELYEIDKQHRNVLAALGLQNIRLF